jgi:hypothetical protein
VYRVTLTFNDKDGVRLDQARGSERRASYCHRQVMSAIRRHPPTASVLEEVARLRSEVRELRERLLPVTAKRSGEE